MLNGKTINLGLIGLGYWGPNFARAAFENENVQLVYCCDLDKKALAKIKRRYPSVKLVSDYKEILKDQSIHGIIIVTPPGTHHKLVKDCLHAGKDVLVEKPITLKSSDAEELMAIAKKGKRILMVDHIFQFNPGVRKLKEIIKKRKLGKIFYLSASYTALGPVRPDVSSLWDLGPHFFYTLEFLLDTKPLWVKAIGQSYLKKNIHDVVYVTLGFPKKILANIHVSWLYPYKVRNLVVVGSKRMGVFDDMLVDQKVRVYDRGAFYDKNDLEYPAILKIMYREGDLIAPRIDLKEPLGEVLRTFVEAIDSRHLREAGAEEGIHVVKILETAQRSLEQHGKKIKIS